MTSSLIGIGTPVDTKVGPGVSVEIDWSIVGPVPPDERWVWQVFQPGAEVFAITQQGSLNGQHQVVFRLGQRAAPTTSVQNDISLPEDTAVSIRVQVLSGTGNVDDSQIFTGFKWTHQVEWQLQGQTEGGFSAADRANLETTLGAVQVNFPITTSVGGVLTQTLGQLVGAPPPSLLTRGESLFLTGSGSLTRPGGLFAVNAFGATWSFFTVPDHYGKELGSTIEYEQRLLQLTIVKKDFGGNEYIDQVVDAHTDTQYLIWGLSLPEVVLYTVAPGVVVQYTWLLLL